MNMGHSGVKLTVIAMMGMIFGSLLMGSVLQLDTYSSLPKTSEDFGTLQRFKSTFELTSFLQKHTAPSMYYLKGLGLPVPAFAGSNGAMDYSSTNVQVAGVDEADMVKTNGKYIYVSKDNVVYIALVFPPDNAKLVSKIILDEGVSDIYIAGNKLVVLSNSNSMTVEPMPKMPGILPPTPLSQMTTLRVYDLSDVTNPKLDKESRAEGSYLTSRMIGDYVYVIVQKGAQIIDGKVQPPMIQEGAKTYQVPSTDIMYYWNGTEPWYTYTTILSLNVIFPDIPATSETFLLGASGTVYVSPQYLYLCIQNWSNTTIQKIRLYNGDITPVAEGIVSGWVLNQFSMDEYDGYFRVATTTGRLWWGWRRVNTNQTSAVYVLDKNMKTVGRLEDLAPREDIYSARFLGGRCYLVTFKKVDPLFVIDLSKPTNPKILGKLKIPGYSNYLHPFDANHVIGLGKEATESEVGDFAWYQGIKISLFDVTDVSRPLEIAKIEVGDRGTDSPALSDHHAFLFSRDRKLLVIPILEAKINPANYEGSPPADAYGDYVSQGAYVFNISLNGINLKGKVTHLQDLELQKSGYLMENSYSVQRSLYIEDYLYTISDAMIKINNLSDLKEVNSIKLK